MNYILLVLFILILALFIYLFLKSLKKPKSATAFTSNIEEDQISDLKCIRCINTNLIFNGVQRFHVNHSSTLFTLHPHSQKQVFDQYYCPSCGKVEFFFRKKKG